MRLCMLVVVGVTLVEQALPQPSPSTYHFELTTAFSGTFVEPAAFPGGFVFVPADPNHAGYERKRGSDKTQPFL